MNDNRRKKEGEEGGKKETIAKEGRKRREGKDTAKIEKENNLNKNKKKGEVINEERRERGREIEGRGKIKLRWRIGNEGKGGKKKR